MAESGYLTINRAAEVELLDYRSRAEIKDLVRGGGYLGVGDNAGAEAVNKNGDGLVNADGVGDFNFALVCKTAATMFFAMYLAAYAAERSTFVGSLPENAPPPWREYPP